MKRKQENFPKEIEVLNDHIPQAFKKAIDFETRAKGPRNELYVALFSKIIRSLGETVQKIDDFSVSNLFWGAETVDPKVFTEIQGKLGTKELFTQRLQLINKACQSNKIPKNADMIKVTQKILSDFTYLKSTADIVKTAENRLQQTNQKLIELINKHNELVEKINAPFNPFEPFEAQGYKTLAREDATLKDLMAKRQALIEASRPYFDKSQEPTTLTQQNQLLEILINAMQDNSEEIAQRAADLNSLIGIYNNASDIKELELAAVFNPSESKLEKTDARLTKLKAVRQELIEKSMSFRGFAQDSDELNTKIKQLLDVKSELHSNSAEIEEREKVLHNRSIKRNKPKRVAKIMTEQQVADEKAAAEKFAAKEALAKKAEEAATEKNQQDFTATYKQLIECQQVNKDLYAELKLINDSFKTLSSQINASRSVSQDSTVNSLKTQYNMLLKSIEEKKLPENDPAILQSNEELHIQRDSLDTENELLKKQLVELTNIKQKFGTAIDSAKQKVIDAKASLENKIKSIENLIASYKDKDPYKSSELLKKGEKNGLSIADLYILRQKQLALGLDQYPDVEWQANYIIENIEEFGNELQEVYIQINAQFQEDVAKLRRNFDDLKSIKICEHYQGARENEIKKLDLELTDLEKSCQKIGYLVDQEKLDTLAEKMKTMAISLNAITTEMDSREKSQEIKVVRELIAEIDNTLAARRMEIGIDAKAPTKDLIITTLHDFKTELENKNKDYLNLTDFNLNRPKPVGLSRVDFITNILATMKTTLTEAKIQDIRKATNSNIFVDFINFIADFFSSLEPLITNNNKKPVYRAQFWPSYTECQVTEAATKAHDALSALHTQLAEAKAPLRKKNAE